MVPPKESFTTNKSEAAVRLPQEDKHQILGKKKSHQFKSTRKRKSQNIPKIKESIFLFLSFSFLFSFYFLMQWNKRLDSHH